MKKSRLLPVACVASVCVGMTAPAFTKTAEAASNAVQDVQALDALGLENNPSVSWGDRQVRGNTYTFSDFRQTGDGFVFTAEQLVIEGLSQGAQGPTFRSARYVDGRTVLDDQGEIMRFDRVTISSPSDALVALLAASFRGEQDERDPFAPFMQATGGLVMEGLSFALSDDSGAQGGDVELSIGRIVLDNEDGDEFADMGLTDFTMLTSDPVSGTAFVFSIESMQGTNVLTESVFNGIDPEQFNPELAFVKTYDAFDMSNMILEVGGIRLVMPSATSAMEEISGGALRTTFDVPNVAVTFDSQADPQAAQAAASLAMLGYDSIDLSYTSSYIFDPATDRLYSDGPNALTLRDGGTFDVRFDMSGMTKYVEAAMEFQVEAAAATEKGDPDAVDEATALAMFNALAVNGMSISFEDNGLLDRGLGLFAMQSGVDVETARVQAAGMVALMSMGAGEVLPQSVLMQMNQAVTGFIQNGGTLEINLQPATPMPIMGMMAADGSFDAVGAGLSFAHESP